MFDFSLNTSATSVSITSQSQIMCRALSMEMISAYIAKYNYVNIAVHIIIFSKIGTACNYK